MISYALLYLRGSFGNLKNDLVDDLVHFDLVQVMLTQYCATHLYGIFYRYTIISTTIYKLFTSYKFTKVIIIVNHWGCAIMTLVKDGLDPGHSLSQMHCAKQKKKFPLILVRGSQSYLSWFIVSLPQTSKNVTVHSEFFNRNRSLMSLMTYFKILMKWIICCALINTRIAKNTLLQ